MNVHFEKEFRRLRHEMVESAIVARGVRSESVLKAMRDVPRESFLPEQLREHAQHIRPHPVDVTFGDQSGLQGAIQHYSRGQRMDVPGCCDGAIVIEQDWKR